MRLKSLSVKGFKSFADETVINFTNKVIGVVGPNGAGKSNVVDAVRWVLGEQKPKELRLEKMSDIIFNGTKKRKEAGLAQATLTFENTRGLLPIEYQNVAVSRILYRSGESEYRLNDVPCRLKDIRSLFADTGIGSNTYAIIALGMVDDILMDKENARRRMFEQAAGISKYKTRKKETLRKLHHTSADLDRIEDLLFEIENNLKGLEKQARRTRKYFELKDNYKELSIQFAIMSVDSLKTDYQQIGKKLKAEQDKYQEIEAIIHKNEASLEKEKKNNLDKEEHLSTEQKKLSEALDLLRAKENEKDLLKQKLTFNKQNKENLKKVITEAEKELNILNARYEDLKGKIKAEQTKEIASEKALNTSQNAYEEIKVIHSKAKEDFDDKVRKIQRTEHLVFDLDKQIAILKNNKENEAFTIKREAELLDSKKKEHKNHKDQLSKLDRSITIKKQEINVLDSKEEKRKNRIIELEEKRDTLRESLNKTNRSLDSKQNEYDLLKSMVENYEGFPESIKFLSSEWKSDIPVLSDLLDVDEPYKGVIEQYLENYLNYYVVWGLDEALSAIKLLTHAQKGKANFFLLDKISKKGIKPVAIPNTVPAVNVVKTEKKYEALLAEILADVYIFEGEVEGFRLGSEFDSYTFLAKSGTFLKRKYSVKGGSVGLFEGKRIGRKKNLEKLEKEIARLKTKRETAIAKVAKHVEELSMLRSTDQLGDLSALRKELANLEQERLGVNIKIENYTELKNRFEVKSGESKKRMILLEQQINEKTKESDKLRKELKKINQQEGEKNQELNVISDKLSKLAEHYNSDNISLIHQQNLVRNLKKDLVFNENRIKEIKDRKRQSSFRLEEEKKERDNIKASIEKTEKELIKAYEEKDLFQKNLNEVEQKYFSVRNTILEMEEKLRVLYRNRNQQQSAVQHLKDNYTDLRFKITAVGDRLKIEFGIALNDVINQELTTSFSREELEAKLEKMKTRLSNFGEINPMAVETYDEMKKRYDTITSQRDDILEAKTSLLETIKEIEDTATEKFLEAFDNVRTNFQDVFRSLFSDEDKCDLKLLDESRPLESVIDIIAKPKGKKPQTLSQLSGGEKTLTAIALLFALYLLKPAPFCIFDEVDAPLDDANIQKFNKIVSKFSEDSQFIIVTHNKSTMAEVEVLYGVYMHEQGVSAVTAVDFRKYEHSPIVQVMN